MGELDKLWVPGRGCGGPRQAVGELEKLRGATCAVGEPLMAVGEPERLQGNQERLWAGGSARCLELKRGWEGEAASEPGRGCRCQELDQGCGGEAADDLGIGSRCWDLDWGCGCQEEAMGNWRGCREAGKELGGGRCRGKAVGEPERGSRCREPDQGFEYQGKAAGKLGRSQEMADAEERLQGSWRGTASAGEWLLELERSCRGKAVGGTSGRSYGCQGKAVGELGRNWEVVDAGERLRGSWKGTVNAREGLQELERGC